jgi:hypothetical protein
MSLLMPRPSLVIATSTPQSTQVYLGLGLVLGLAFAAERFTGFLRAVFFFALFFVLRFFAVFFFAVFLVFFFAFFRVGFLAAFFLALRTAIDSPPFARFHWTSETSILRVEILSRFSLVSKNAH